MTNENFIKWFRELSIDDVPLVGGKNASLGEMFRELTPKGVKIPDGFAVTAEAYRYFIKSSELEDKIQNTQSDMNPNNIRDSEIISHIFDERNDAVKSMISNVIKVAKDMDKKIGICGQAPSDFPEFAGFLVKEGIDSISLNSDTVLKTTKKIVEFETKFKETEKQL